ncbi:alpha/beta hydrolase family protein [Chryseobacterium profundimaris]|uniref:Prolyl oligopeptidase family protein n=2 Tax=Chryseobacterium TaxID=59732 RepID=A0ABY1NL27_9FLAO|nr:prolyl oligopeptidase family serine peptidase [Chryseobacterium profundimaris]SMP12386.1 Prolyl oligopeptidase family protein [Chryseobacterium profundimaris]
MKAIRIYLLGFLFIQGFCFSQNIDSLESIYSKYYETALLANSPEGRYVVLNHSNTYGKDDFELFDVKMDKGTKLEKHLKFQFLTGNLLLMQNDDHCRILNLKTGQHHQEDGRYIFTIAKKSEQLILYSSSTKELLSMDYDGKILWKQNDIGSYQFDDKNDRLIYNSGKQLSVRNLKTQQVKTFNHQNDVQWLSYSEKKIYCAEIKATKIELCTVNLMSDQLTRMTINSPQGFEFTANLNSYLEIREDSHLLLPLFAKSKLSDKKDPELQISYSNRNDHEKTLNHHMGIYNLKEEKWDYQPDAKQKLPVYRFLNDKGDFIVFDQSNDVVEEQQNVVLDLNLTLDYGKSSYLLPKKRINDGNYLWDRSTEQFIYFDDKRWMCHHLTDREDHELLPLDIEGWENPNNNGLTYSPEVNPIKIKGRSAIMLSNQFDYFLIDLKDHQVKRMTKGQDQQTRYRLQLSKDHYPRSSWNVKFPEIDLGKEMLFKLFNTTTYDTGFATYLYKKNKINFYRHGHYKDILPYKNGSLLISYFALEPFKLTIVEKGQYRIVYESMKTEKKDFGNAKYKLFQYKTRYGTANAALLYPSDYNEQQKYPMIVNIYDQKSHDLLLFIQPFLTTTFGFNYMHYLMNGYIILLPDLQYETGKIKDSIITSLEKSIDTARSIASVDEKNVGVLGLSFGGYETGLALTNSNYFKTGVAGVMVSDLVSLSLSYSEFDSMPNYRRTENQQIRMRDMLFENWNGYLENSPIYHMKNISIPVLVWTGSKDRNVNPFQSKMFFLGMKRLQKKAVFLEYLNETHNILLPSNQLDLNVKTWQWFDHYLKNRTPAEWIRPITQ